MLTLKNLQKIIFKYQYNKENNIKTHLTYDEKYKLYSLAKECEGDVCVEIGSYLGASSCFIAAGINKSGRKANLFCIDTWFNNSMTEGERDTFEEFKINTIHYKNLIIPLRGYSTKVIDETNKYFRKIDFLFIDGDHSYESCKKDWDLYGPLLNTNSIVIFHDIGWAEGVQRVVKEDVIPRFQNYDNLPNLFWAWNQK